jgi:hypothetical protein
MKKIIVLVVLIVSMGFVLFSCRDTKKEEDDKEVAVNVQYICPMDCEHGKTYDAEGTCPICKMELKKVEKEHDKKQN